MKPVIIGDATLYLGDCLELMRGLPDASVDMVLCDLPYGTTRNKWDSIIPLDRLWSEYKRVCRGVIALTAQTPFDKVLGLSNIKMLRYEWIWQKERGTGHLNAKKMPMKLHENILIFYDFLSIYNPQMRPGEAYYRSNSGTYSGSTYDNHSSVPSKSGGERYPVSILNFKRERGLHQTQKPVALMEYLIRTYTNEGDKVLDNCMGSGTTGVACANTGRSFIGMELDAAYFEIAQDRIQRIADEKEKP